MRNTVLGVRFDIPNGYKRGESYVKWTRPSFSEIFSKKHENHSDGLESFVHGIKDLSKMKIYRDIFKYANLPDLWEQQNMVCGICGLRLKFPIELDLLTLRAS